MAIAIYNTLSRKAEEFKPIRSGEVRMYVCGVTVYDECHIGHARSAFIFDVIRRYFKYRGYNVKLVKNITDVDDKIIEKAREEVAALDSPLKELNLNDAVKRIADRYTQRFYEDMELLDIDRADEEPKATEHIQDMIKMIEVLIKNGYAYKSDGDVYFEVRKYNKYGQLSHQNLDEMLEGARVEVSEKKKDPLDFALWKAAKENEPKWEAPWGWGRPGWHIECSVMSTKYLGDNFDIHGGGRDLIFPHHENEIAQSECATGKQFANYWIHNGLLTINGEKMSKSAGNFVTIKDVLNRYSFDILKLFFLGTHYSHPIDFSWEKMEEKRKALNRIIIFLKTVKKREDDEESLIKTDLKKKISSEELRNEIKKARANFEKAMDDDFNMPNAIAALFEIVNVCNKVLYDTSYNKGYLLALTYARQTIEEFGNILGLFFKESPLTVPEEDIKILVNMREELRKQKMFEKADQVRKELEEKGIILEDEKDGTHWRRKA